MSLTVTVLLASGGVLIGALLSLLGAGGSILLLPLLVSGFEAWSNHSLEEPAMAANPPHQPYKPYQRLLKK